MGIIHFHCSTTTSSGFHSSNTLLSVVQISGAVAGIASTDTLADMIRPSAATRFLSVVSSINNTVALLALILSLVVFNTISIDRAYWVLYIVALASAVISTMALASLKDVKVARGDGSTLTNSLDLISKYKSVVLETPTARRYLAVTSAFHLAVNIPAPFWDYYIMVVIGGDESWVTVKNITMLSSKALALRILAPLIDSMGAKRSLYISMTAVSPIPLLYYNATSVLELVGTSVFSSIAWTPWDVASALYVYYLVSDDRRPAFTSLQSISSNMAATLGSAIGSWIRARLGIYHVFLASSILRLAIAMLAYRMTPELKHFSSRGSRSGDPRR